MAQKKRRKKHIPQRTCIGCRKVQSKRSLIRIVRTRDGVKVDITGKQPGRGAYLHDRSSCWERGLDSRIATALKTELTNQDRDVLMAYMKNLPEEDTENI